jgi:hypothetical protein
MRCLKIIVIVLLAITACVGWGKYLDLRIRTALAEEQTKFFAEILEQPGRRKVAGNIASDIEAIKTYYPSGSKQRTGSHLDRMVERACSQAIKTLEEETIRLKAELPK